jgi:hypothetical protein
MRCVSSRAAPVTLQLMRSSTPLHGAQRTCRWRAFGSSTPRVLNATVASSCGTHLPVRAWLHLPRSLRLSLPSSSHALRLFTRACASRALVLPGCASLCLSRSLGTTRQNDPCSSVSPSRDSDWQVRTRRSLPALVKLQLARSRSAPLEAGNSVRLLRYLLCAPRLFTRACTSHSSTDALQHTSLRYTPMQVASNNDLGSSTSLGLGRAREVNGSLHHALATTRVARSSTPHGAPHTCRLRALAPAHRSITTTRLRASQLLVP